MSAAPRVTLRCAVCRVSDSTPVRFTSDIRDAEAVGAHGLPTGWALMDVSGTGAFLVPVCSSTCAAMYDRDRDAQ